MKIEDIENVDDLLKTGVPVTILDVGKPEGENEDESEKREDKENKDDEENINEFEKRIESEN